MLCVSGKAHGYSLVRSFSRKSVGVIPRSIPGVTVLRSGKGFSEEKDPGNVMGTKLRILKYPDPKVQLMILVYF